MCYASTYNARMVFDADFPSIFVPIAIVSLLQNNFLERIYRAELNVNINKKNSRR